MTLAKTQIKRDAFNQVGNRLDDMLEELEKSKLKAEGASVAVSGLTPKIEALYKHVNKDLDEGVIKDIAEAKLIKTYITRVLDVCEESAQAAKRTRIKLGSKAEGISASLFEVKKLFDHEDAAIRQALFLSKNAEGSQNEHIINPPGIDDAKRPAPSIKARRQAEEIIQKVEAASVPKEVLEEKEEIEVKILPSEDEIVLDPMEEIQKVQKQAQRADGRFQCGGCKRHFKTWNDLMQHCSTENHVPRS